MTTLSIVRTVLSSLGLVLHSDYDVVRARLVEEHTLRIGREKDLLHLISRAGEVIDQPMSDEEVKQVRKELSKAEIFLRRELHDGSAPLMQLMRHLNGTSKPPFYDPERVMPKPVKREEFTWWTKPLQPLEQLPAPLGECGSCALGAGCPLHDAPAGGEQS